MKGIDVSESLVNSVLDFVKPGHSKKLDETKKEAEAKKVAESTEVEEAEEHVCPLCESKLEKALTQEQLQEHVNYFLNVINENFEVDGGSLDEEADEGESDSGESVEDGSKN